MMQDLVSMALAQQLQDPHPPTTPTDQSSAQVVVEVEAVGVAAAPPIQAMQVLTSSP